MSSHSHHPHSHHDKPPKKIHQSPWVVVGAILMLIAMVCYVLTLDDSVLVFLKFKSPKQSTTQPATPVTNP
ncbi:MAG: hypothetical protein WCI46_09435 [Verrucomicrobiota bacterium]